MKKMLLVLSLLVLTASMAWAYPGPDGMGIYADVTDTGPVENCVIVPAFVQTNLYMCITNPSGSPVLAWEARITNNAPAGAIIGNWVMSGLDVDNDPEDFVVGNGLNPLQPNAQGVVVLGELQLFVVNPAVTIDFTITHIPGSVSFPGGTPGYVHTLGFNTPCYTATGGTAGPPYVYNPVFRVNGPEAGQCIVANEDASWSEIKTLYR
ncbi:MAG: hypothetical protein Q7W56_02420 [Candidatus Latescibacteria bacterium]|nr:hypothetical protein [Candidatus Latescibacterota bacterium]